jgi:CDP-6-deoxy-D-xylo-4-hexulose-3-dehydrase
MTNFSYPLASTTWGIEEPKSVESVLASGLLTMGVHVKNFEQEFAEYIGTKYAVMFNSGSSANLGLLAGLKYMKDSILKDGDEIIVPAVSWSTTFYPVTQLGFKLSFVDVNENTLNIDLSSVERAVTPRTRAIFAVNLLGNPAELTSLQEIADTRQLILIEDNCESLGAKIDSVKTGAFGLAGSHSFYFSHHICTIEGGMVTTNSKILMETMHSIRAHGWLRGLDAENSIQRKSNNPWEDLYKFALPGYNLRPIEFAGAIGKVQLEKFPQFLEERRKNAKIFVERFKDDSDLLIQEENGESSWFGFSIILRGKLSGYRGPLIEHLTNSGVETRPIVAGNFTLNPVMKHLAHVPIPELPVSDLIHKAGFFVGNHHYSIEQEILRLYDSIDSFRKTILA